MCARFYNSQLVQPVSQFVPENLDFYQGRLEDMQKSQDQYSLNLDALGKNTNALVNDLPGAMKTKQEIDARLEKLRSVNYNDPKQRDAALKEIGGIRNVFSPFGALGAREEKLKKYNQQLEEINKDKNDFKKAYRLQQLQQSNLAPEAAIKFDPYGKPTNTEIVVPPDFEYKDKNEVLPKLLDKVKADVISVNSGLTKEGANEALFSYLNGNVEELKGQKIYNYLKQAVLTDPNLMKSISAEGSYFGQDPNIILENSIRAIAQAGAYKKSNIDRKYEKDDLALYRAKKADDIKDANITTSSQSEALPGTLVTIPNEIKNLEFDEKGNIKPIYKGGQTYTQSNSLYNDAPIVTNSKKEVDTQALQDAQALVNKLQNEHPDLKGLNPKQVIEAYKKGISSLEAESIPLESIGNVAAKGIGEALARNKAQRNFYLFDGKGKTSDGQLSTVLDELNIKEEDLNKALEKGISGFTQAGPSAGGYYIEVPDSKGNSRRVVISPDAEIGKIFRPSQMINEARKAFSNTEIKPFEERPDYSIIIKPNIDKEGNTTWKYFEILKDQSGNILQQAPTTLNDIREVEKTRFKNSGYLGSQIGTLKPHTVE